SPISGITSKIDYLADLGINTIWLTPVFDGTGMGYGTWNYYKIHPDLGTVDDLKDLVEKAHSKGVRVLLDLVISHSGIKHAFFTNTKALKSQSPFKDYYMWAGEPGTSSFQYYNDWTELPNFNVNNDEVKNYLYGVAEYWVRECDIDGYRCDVAWGIEDRNPAF